MVGHPVFLKGVDLNFCVSGFVEDRLCAFALREEGVADLRKERTNPSLRTLGAQREALWRNAGPRAQLDGRYTKGHVPQITWSPQAGSATPGRNIPGTQLGTFSGLFVASEPFCSGNFPFCSVRPLDEAAIKALIYLRNLERAMGIEPTTYSLGSCRSTTELRPQGMAAVRGGFYRYCSGAATRCLDAARSLAESAHLTAAQAAPHGDFCNASSRNLPPRRKEPGTSFGPLICRPRLSSIRPSRRGLADRSA